MSLQLIAGPMFSGKTTKLLNIVKDKSPLVLKPVIDDRYGKNTICSQDGGEQVAINISSITAANLDESFRTSLSNNETIVLDEGTNLYLTQK